VLVPLFAPLAPPFGNRLIEVKERNEPAQDGQGRQQPQQIAAAAGSGQGSRQGIEVAAGHPSSVSEYARACSRWDWVVLICPAYEQPGPLSPRGTL
jgi:hypothetical protein